MEGLGWQSRIRVVDKIGKTLPTLPHALAICGGLQKLPELAEIAKMRGTGYALPARTSEEAHFLDRVLGSPVTDNGG